MRSLRRREVLEGYVYLLPWIVGFVAFVGGPILASAYLSLTKYNVLRPPELVGLQNYVYAFSKDDLFLPSIVRTFYFAVLSIPPAMVGSLVVAMLLNQRLVANTLWRTMFFLPTLTPVVAAALLWRWMLNPDVGLVNFLLAQVGIKGPGWLASIEWAIPALALVGLWVSVGGSRMIIFLAGLQDVPQDLVEAAEIDGAGAWAKFWNVTLPMITPTVFFNLVLGIIFALRTFDLAFISTGGGPARATWFISLHIYQNAFVSFDMGYASALSWMFFVVLFGLTYLQFRLSGSWVFYAGERR
ncbi:MAG TPA: sugar ABC transporter permease [Chloroflexota bacterium]|jgi:multiple sugar transport system permease protein|nr:sugar ABC transporter permease [Chloroflexota bacterium]